MSPRTGRPPKTEPTKTKSLQLRVKQETLDKLQNCAELLQVSRTVVIEKGIELVEMEIDGNKK